MAERGGAKGGRRYKHEGDKFTHEQEKFIAAWDGSVTSTAQRAGLSYNQCKHWMCPSRKQYQALRDAIRAREHDSRDGLIADRQERQAFWTAVMRDESRDMPTRLKASELLGKSECDFSEKRVHEGELGLVIKVVKFGADQDSEDGQDSE